MRQGVSECDLAALPSVVPGAPQVEPFYLSRCPYYMHLYGWKWWKRQAPVPTHMELSDTPSAAYLQRKLEAQQYKLNVEKQLVSDLPLRS